VVVTAYIKKTIMKQEAPDGWTDIRLVSDPLRHLANLTGCPLLSDSVALSASNWAFNPSSSEGLGGTPLVIAPTKASRAW
jgi:hypothetical protein